MVFPSIPSPFIIPINANCEDVRKRYLAVIRQEKEISRSHSSLRTSLNFSLCSSFSLQSEKRERTWNEESGEELKKIPQRMGPIRQRNWGADIIKNPSLHSDSFLASQVLKLKRKLFILSAVWVFFPFPSSGDMTYPESILFPLFSLYAAFPASIFVGHTCFLYI